MPTVDKAQFEVVPGMAEAIEARMVELKIADVATLHAMTRLAPKILKHLLSGYRKGYKKDTRLRFCAALQWTHSSVAQLMRGEPATPLPKGKSVSRSVDPVVELQRQMRALWPAVHELLHRAGLDADVWLRELPAEGEDAP